MQLHPSSPTPLHPVYPNNLRSVDSQDQPTNHWLALRPTKTTMIRASNSILLDLTISHSLCVVSSVTQYRCDSEASPEHSLDMNCPQRRIWRSLTTIVSFFILDEPVVALWKVIRL